MSRASDSTRPGTPWVIETQDLTKVYRLGATEVRALAGVTLRVAKGEFVSLMGSSGSGKSTLLHLLGCLDSPTAGSYLLNGKDTSRLSLRDRARLRNAQIGFVFQSYNLLPRISALENVALPLMYRGSARGIKERALEALTSVGLKERAHHAPSELSGGERQRVAIARALVADPTLLLADEPTGNLDSATGEDIMSLLAHLHRQGRTIFMVTHDRNIAAFAQRSMRMMDGLVLDGSLNDAAD